MSKGKFIKLQFFATAQDALDNKPISGGPEMYWLNSKGIELSPEPNDKRLLEFIDRGGDLSCLPFVPDKDITGNSKHEGAYVYTDRAQFDGMLSAPVKFFRDTTEQRGKMGW